MALGSCISQSIELPEGLLYKNSIGDAVGLFEILSNGPGGIRANI